MCDWQMRQSPGANRAERNCQRPSPSADLCIPRKGVLEMPYQHVSSAHCGAWQLSARKCAWKSSCSCMSR
jgi:hypothetical protein